MNTGTDEGWRYDFSAHWCGVVASKEETDSMTADAAESYAVEVTIFAYPYAGA